MTARDEQQAHQTIYRIQIRGPISPIWADWLGRMEITSASEQDEACLTTLTGPIADQAALRGILTRIWDMNLTLVSVTRLEDDQA